MINETSIRCFLNLCETLSFTETAGRMFMTQQSVSKYIAKFEEDLGLTLFYRTRHYVRMSKSGEELHKLFSEFDARLLSTMADLRRLSDEKKSSLNVGYLEWLDLSGLLSGALDMMRRDHPNMQLRGEKQPQFELNQSFLKKELDLIITYREFEPRGKNIKSRLILETPLIMLVHPDNPNVSEAANAASFINEPFIKAAASGESLSESRTRAQAQCRELGLEPREIIIAPNLESGYLAAELGQGIIVSTVLSRMSLGSILLSYPIGKNESLKCAWYSDNKNPTVMEFAECLQKTGRVFKKQ